MKAWVARVSIYTVALIFFGIASLLFFHAVYQIKKYTFFIDPYCSLSAAHEFKNHIQSNTYFSTAILKTLTDQFPCLEQSSIALSPLGIVHCSLRVSQPQLILNQDHILLANNVIVAKNMFDSLIISSLPQIALASDYSLPTISDGIKNILQTIPADLLNEYAISFVNPTIIRLVDKQNPKIVIIADKESIKTFNRAHCKTIEEKEKKIIEKKSKLVMDVRFASQIVVRWNDVQGGIL